MPNDLVNIVKKYGPVVLISAAVGAGIYALATAAPLDEEDRPPIIVHNGSLDISVQYPDDTYQNKGVWALDGNAKTWSHSHQLPGPVDTRNTIFGLDPAKCTGVGSLKNGGLRITFTDETSSWSVEIGANPGKKQMQIDPKNEAVSFSLDGNESSHLVIKPSNDTGAATRISKVESLNGNGVCEFAPGTMPTIQMEQKHK